MSDTELLEQFKNGDAESLEILIRRHQTALYSFLLSYTKSEDSAQDIFQEVFLKIVEKPDIFKGGNFKAWLFTVARNKCMDYFRSLKTETVSIDMEIEEGLTLESVLASEEELPLDRLLSKEENARLYSVLSALSAEQREVILLKEEFSFKEISELLSAPLGTVLARANRGYKKMKEMLEAL